MPKCMRIVELYSDRDLLERMKGDDVQAFEQIYRKYAPSLFHAAFNILKDTQVCEDLIQDLFISLWVKRDGLAIISLKSYLFRATKNNVLMYIRSHHVQLDISELEVLCSHVSSSDLLLTNELQDSLNQSLDQLPEKCRKIFEMSRFRQLSHKEIATELNISVKTVENQIGIALKRLKILLKDFTYLIILFLYC